MVRPRGVAGFWHEGLPDFGDTRGLAPLGFQLCQHGRASSLVVFYQKVIENAGEYRYRQRVGDLGMRKCKAEKVVMGGRKLSLAHLASPFEFFS